MQISENLKRLRKKSGLTQGELAEKAGILLGQVSRIERGENSPNAETIYGLMNALECTANKLMMDERKTKAGSALQMAIEKTIDLPEKERETITRVITAIANNYKMEKMAKENLA